MSVHQFLRQATRDAHDRVDGAFARYDLNSRAGYLAFLCAHGRALPAAEAVLTEDAGLPDWSPRTPLLRADLRALDAELPAPLACSAPATRAGMLGLLYVVEGSRLGGAVLARTVAPDLPAAYLSARHAPGGWRALLARLDADEVGDGGWREAALVGALAGFSLFAAAADA